MCAIEDFRVLQVLNPKDQIEPFSSTALLVKFHPIEVKKYYIKIDAKYKESNNSDTTFIYEISGDGISKPANRSKEKERSPGNSTFSKSVPINFSSEHIYVRNLQIWNRKTEIIFIRNMSPYLTIQYIWHSVTINDIIEITAEQRYGILEPKQIQPVVIVVKSFSNPCIGSVLLPCELVNYTGTILHQFTKEQYDKMEKAVEQEFTITEKATIDQQKNPIKIYPKPKPTLMTICVDITTIHTKDLDQIMEVEKQLEQCPNQSMQNVHKSLLKKYYPDICCRGTFPETENQPKININDSKLFCRILQEIISEVLFSNTFKFNLELITKTPSHYYTEFVMSDQAIMSSKKVDTPLSVEDIASFRKWETEKFLKQLKITELSTIFQNIIYESLMMVAKCPLMECNIKEINEKIKKQIFSCKNIECTCHNT
ncbi:uncharacterized protein LOC143191826 [Rhynchophorus ferrugineus]|uniref:uncharacterized protein LOC143191826 n=1 Tax=Rhynchophorus ferrugineus TaxID=354439 RepID=UPI003FCE891F